MAEVITGIEGKLSKDGVEIADVRKWQAVRKSDNKKYSSSSTAGWQKTAAGVKSWDFTFDIYLQDGDLEIGVTEGETYEFVGTTVAGKTFTGTARISQITEGADIEGAALESAQVSADGHGAYAIV